MTTRHLKNALLDYSNFHVGTGRSAEITSSTYSPVCDAGAESLSKHTSWLSLNGLTDLSDAAAESLGKHKGDLGLAGLPNLSDAAAETEFQIFDAGTLSGTFSAVLLPDLPGMLDWGSSDLYRSGTLSVIPEPATLPLLALGVLLAWRRQ